MTAVRAKYTTPVEKYCLLDIKVAADEQAAQHFSSLGWKENHIYTDVKLVLGYISAAIALTDFGLTWKKEFQSVRYISLYTSVSYFFIAGLLFLWINLVQGRTVYRGQDSTKKGIYSFSTRHSIDNNHQPIYTVNLTLNIPGEQPRKIDAIVPFSNFVDDLGRISVTHFGDELNKLINKIKPSEGDKKE